MKRGLLAGLLFFALVAGLALAQDGESPAAETFYDPQLLAFGDWYYRDGDDPSFANPDADLSGWTKIEPGSSPPRHIGFRWYRAEFTIGWHYRSRQLGLYLGEIAQAHEAHLNNRLVAKLGGMSPEPVGSARKRSLTQIDKLHLWYSFLKLTETNTLAVRIESYTEPIRFDTTQVQIDDFDRLILRARTEESTVNVIQGASISVLLLIGLFCGFLFVSGLQTRENMLFGLFVLAAALLIFLDSLMFFDLGAQAPLVDRSLVFGRLVCVVIFCRLMRAEIAKQFEPLAYRVENAAFVIAGLFVVTGNLLPLRYFDLLIDLACIALFCPSLWALTRAARDDPPVFGVWLGLAVAFAAAFVFEFLFGSPQFALGVVQTAYLVVAFVFLYAIARRYQEMSRNMAALNERLVTVRDLERMRLARDLHDGLGQGIAAVGLHLKMLTSGETGPKFARLTESLDYLNSQVSEVLQDLRPLALRNARLDEAIERHLKRTLEGTGIRYSTSLDPNIELPFPVREQLFRIYQEALNNALKHANCTEVSVSTSRSGRKVRLVISDNGGGFIVRDNRDLGLGLSTMRERASLINASYSLKSEAEAGCTIRLEVRLDD